MGCQQTKQAHIPYWYSKKTNFPDKLQFLLMLLQLQLLLLQLHALQMCLQRLQVFCVHFQVKRVFHRHSTPLPTARPRLLLFSQHNAALSAHNPRFGRRNPLSLLRACRSSIRSHSSHSSHSSHRTHRTHRTHRRGRELRRSLGRREVFDDLGPRNAAMEPIRSAYGRE